MIPDFADYQIVLGIMLTTITVILILQGFRRWHARKSKYLPGKITSLPPSLIVQPRLLFTKSEIALYNLIRLAVQDNYLVLAKLPMRKLIRVESQDDVDRRALFRIIQRVFLDFVLVHPGTRIPAWVIQIEGTPNTPYETRVVNVLFQRAGIDILRLKRETAYTLPQLVDLLRLNEES